MSTGSPSAYLLWAILACTFQSFLIQHLWFYDHFKCIKWDSGRQPGAFKRIMTYSYIATLPLLVIFGVSMTVLKYKEGYIVLDEDIVPRPFSVWGESSRHWLIPLFFLLSVAWAFEIITHLEELTFWLFLLHQGPSRREWFRSGEFRLWYMGSMIAIVGMPICVLVRRKTLDTCLAWIFLSGSSAGTFTTFCFLYVLARFPGFVRHVKEEGAGPEVTIRLLKFYQLNVARIVFRFLFTIPLIILGIDGVQGPRTINSHAFASDFLLMIGGIGCFASSAITLLIFFPRSITRESGYSHKLPSSQSSKSPTPTSPRPEYYRYSHPPRSPTYAYSRHSMSPIPTDAVPQLTPDYELVGVSYPAPVKQPRLEEHDDPSPTPVPHSWRYSTRIVGVRHPLYEERMSANTVHESTVHPYVMNFTSPIDLSDTPGLPRAI